jgi:hypothetical protein
MQTSVLQPRFSASNTGFRYFLPTPLAFWSDIRTEITGSTKSICALGHIHSPYRGNAEAIFWWISGSHATPLIAMQRS